MDKAAFIQQVRALGPTYFPNERVQSQLSHVELVAIVGPTGAGKTTIIKELDLPIIKVDITRPQREDEKKSESYNFRSDFGAMWNELSKSEYVQFVVSRSDEFYGSHHLAYPEAGRCTMAIVAEAIPSFQRLGFKNITLIYVMPPGYVEWMHRIGKVRAHDLPNRMQEAVTSIKMAIRDESYHFVLNDDLRTVVSDIHKILDGAEVAEHRTQLARDTADMLLERLGDQSDDLYF